MVFSKLRLFFVSSLSLILLLNSCAPVTVPSAENPVPAIAGSYADIPPGFATVDASRRLIFPKDFGAHEDFRTEWWYYTGNLQTPEGRHFGFELTIFRVSLLPPAVELPADSQWYSHSIYFAHFAISDVAGEHFYAFERYSRPGPGLAGAESDPYRIWLEDWNITEGAPGVYNLQAEQEEVELELTLTDQMGIVLHGVKGYTRGGENSTNSAYYYSQPRLRADGTVQLGGVKYTVSGLAWHDHEFSSGKLDQNQIGWDWFSLQFEEGPALMLFQLREREGAISTSSSGTFIAGEGSSQPVENNDFEIAVLDQWHSPHTQGVYPAAWEIRLKEPNCLLEVHPWLADQEVNFPTVTYWEGAIYFDGVCSGVPVHGDGYVELTGYAGNLPLP